MSLIVIMCLAMLCLQVEALLEAVLAAARRTYGNSPGNNPGNSSAQGKALTESNPLDEGGIRLLLQARGADAAAVRRAADEVRRLVVGDVVTYVVNRNINYTNVCTYK